MAEKTEVVAIVKMDKQGRILIPAKVRKRLGTSVFALEVAGEELRLKPVRALRLSALFDSIEVEAEDFTDTHALRRGLHGQG